MSREDIAYELIREVFTLGPGKLATFEYLRQIPVLFDELRPLNLKISFREFRFKKRIPELHINLGPLCCLAKQRNARHKSEFWDVPRFER